MFARDFKIKVTIHSYITRNCAFSVKTLCTNTKLPGSSHNYIYSEINKMFALYAQTNPRVFHINLLKRVRGRAIIAANNH